MMEVCFRLEISISQRTFNKTNPLLGKPMFSRQFQDSC
jgi:hypothetical protein